MRWRKILLSPVIWYGVPAAAFVVAWVLGRVPTRALLLGGLTVGALEVLFRVVAAAQARDQRARGWQRIGLCAGCGRDLVDCPERCPRCGRVPAAVRNQRPHGGEPATERLARPERAVYACIAGTVLVLVVASIVACWAWVMRDL